MEKRLLVFTPDCVWFPIGVRVDGKVVYALVQPGRDKRNNYLA